MTGYERLANAIILQTVKDYRSALKRIKMNPSSKSAMSDAMECERFFHSAWYSALTDISAEYLINKLRMEVKSK